jgi:hypothetical protein
VQQAQKLFWAHPMELVGDVGQVEAGFNLFGDSVNLNGTPGDLGQIEAHFGLFGDSANLDAC